MLDNLLREIANEASQLSDEDLIAKNVDETDLKDAFLDEDSNFEEGADLTDGQIRDLIKKIPESKDDLSKEEISQLAESFELLIDENAIFESCEGNIGAKVLELQKESVQLSDMLLSETDDSRLERVKEALGEVNGRINFLTSVQESLESISSTDGFESYVTESENVDLTEDDEFDVEGDEGDGITESGTEDLDDDDELEDDETSESDLSNDALDIEDLDDEDFDIEDFD